MLFSIDPVGTRPNFKDWSVMPKYLRVLVKCGTNCRFFSGNLSDVDMFCHSSAAVSDRNYCFVII